MVPEPCYYKVAMCKSFSVGAKVFNFSVARLGTKIHSAAIPHVTQTQGQHSADKRLDQLESSFRLPDAQSDFFKRERFSRLILLGQTQLQSDVGSLIGLSAARGRDPLSLCCSGGAPRAGPQPSAPRFLVSCVPFRIKGQSGCIATQLWGLCFNPSFVAFDPGGRRPIAATYQDKSNVWQIPWLSTTLTDKLWLLLDTIYRGSKMSIERSLKYGRTQNISLSPSLLVSVKRT